MRAEAYEKKEEKSRARKTTGQQRQREREGAGNSPGQDVAKRRHHAWRKGYQVER